MVNLHPTWEVEYLATTPAPTPAHPSEEADRG